MFRWATEEELVPPDVYHALQAVGGLRMNRTDARRFFELSPRAKKKQIESAYELSQRALIRRFAIAASDQEMHSVQRARAKLRTIRNFAVS